MRARTIRFRKTHRGVSPSFPEAVTAEDAPGCGLDAAGWLRDVLLTQVRSTAASSSAMLAELPWVTPIAATVQVMSSVCG